MGTTLPKPPTEKSAKAERLTDRGLLAPAFDRAITRVQDRVERATGARPLVWETLRTETRQTYLFGFGRDYDDGRGVVTKARTARTTYHGFGCAVDVIHPRLLWSAPAAWWEAVGAAARAEGLMWGGDFPSIHDAPHIQIGRPAPLVPSALDRAVLDPGGPGLLSMWARYGVA